MASTNYTYTFDNTDGSWTHFVSTRRTVTELNAGAASTIPKYAAITSVQAKFRAWKTAPASVDLYVESCNNAGSTSDNLGLYSKRGAITSTQTDFIIPIGSSYYNSANALSGQLKGLRTYLQYRVGSENLLHQLYIQQAKLQWNYTEPTLEIVVTATDGGAVSGGCTFTITAPGQSCATTITATPSAGYRFVQWSDGNKNASRNLSFTDSDLTATNTTKTFVATFEKIPYYVSVQTVDQSGNTITAPSGQTGNTTYYVGDTITVAAPSGDYNYNNDTTYVFSHWSLHDANGNTLVGTNSNRSYTVGTINATTISQWFSGGTTITAKAHYQKVYDLVLSLSGVTAEDPSGVGNAGFDEVVITSGSQSYTFAREDLLSANASDHTQRLTAASATVVFKLTSNSTYQFVQPSYENLIVTGSQGIWNSSQQVTWYVTCSTSHPTLQISVLKKEFVIKIFGDRYNTVPVYRYDTSLSEWVKVSKVSDYLPAQYAWVTSCSIARDQRIKIDTTDTATGTYNTPYRVTSRSSNTDGVTFTDNVCEISSLKRDISLTIAFETVEFTVTDVVEQTEPDGTTSSSLTLHEHVQRSTPYTFSYSDVSGYQTISAVVTNSNDNVKYSLLDNSVTQYEYPGVYEDLTFTVKRSADANAFVYAQVVSCPHGVVQITPDSALRSNFDGFLYAGVRMEAAYEVVSATYQWSEDGVPQGNPVALSPNTLIQYSGTMPSGVDVRCLITVTTRKNTLYYQQVTQSENSNANNEFIIDHTGNNVLFVRVDVRAGNVSDSISNATSENFYIEDPDNPDNYIILNGKVQAGIDALASGKRVFLFVNFLTVYYRGMSGRPPITTDHFLKIPLRQVAGSSNKLKGAIETGEQIGNLTDGKPANIYVTLTAGTEDPQNPGEWLTDDRLDYVINGDVIGLQRIANLYCTMVGETPAVVSSAWIQTSDNPFPQLLYGDEDDFIIRRTVYDSTYAELNILTQTMTVTGNTAVPTERCAVFQDWWPYVRHVKWLISDVAGNTMPEHALDGFVYLEDVQTSLNTNVSRNAHIDGERLVIDSLSTDDAENYTFTIEDEGLVVSYGSD